MKHLLLALLLAIPLPLAAQKLYPRVYIRQSVRDTLAARWDDNDPYQPERAYCGVISKYDSDDGSVSYVVEFVSPAKSDSGQKAKTNQYTVYFTCPATQFSIILHTHPPATCEQWATGFNVCYLGGADAYECEPSDNDASSLITIGEPFAIVQCDRYALIPYFPTIRVPKRLLSPLKIPAPKVAALPKPHSVLKSKKHRY